MSATQRTDAEWALIRRARERLRCGHCGRFLARESISQGECFACRCAVTEANRAAFVMLSDMGDDWAQEMVELQHTWQKLMSERMARHDHYHGRER